MATMNATQTAHSASATNGINPTSNATPSSKTFLDLTSDPKPPSEPTPSHSILTSSGTLDVTACRTHFPALQQSHQTFFDNAGGSQYLGSVSQCVREYLEETNVQLGASYNVAKQSTEAYDKGVQAAAGFLKVGVDEVGMCL